MKTTSARRRSRTSFRPRLESLETRLTPTTYTVSSLADSSAGSLRAAITSVNADNTPDEIDFSVAGVIQLTSGALPAITNAVTIDGTTAPGFAGAPVVEVDNNGFAGLTIGAPNSSLASLSIVNANGPGVTLEGGPSTIVGNYIGLALDGSVAPNTGVGLFIDLTHQYPIALSTIGGTAAGDRNVISGNGAGGILVGSSGQQLLQSAEILGNFIGTDPTGLAAAPNQGNGITVFSNGADAIGGMTAGAGGNTIAFNSQSGVVIDGSIGPADGFGTDSAILSNSIFNNGAKGIVLQNNGNENLPAPQLGYAVESPGSTNGSVQVQVGGVLNVAGVQQLEFGGIACTVQVFATLNGVPAGQGQLFLGSVNVNTNANGFATFTLRNASVPAGGGTTFTATTSTGGYGAGASPPDFPVYDTSAFSSSIGTSTANQAYVANAYQLLLSRIPDPSASAWVNELNNGAPPATVVLGIESSPEYLGDQVTAMYKLYLQRSPDTAGEQAWTSFLQAGGTFEQVAAGLTSSQEYFVLQGGTNQGFITGLYADVLKRGPTTGDLAYWETALDAGVSRASVAVAFLSSQEYRTELVQNDYMTFLMRSADSGGLTAWVDALNAGATDQQVLAQIFGSPEGYQLWSRCLWKNCWASAVSIPPEVFKEMKIMQTLGKFSRFFGTRHRRAQNNRFRRSCGPMLTVEALESRDLLSGNGLDPTFGTGGEVNTSFGGNDAAAKVLVQPNGKIVAVGTITSGGVSSFALARYNSDGSLETTFGTNGKVN
jgi:hypothetical protein